MQEEINKLREEYRQFLMKQTKLFNDRLRELEKMAEGVSKTENTTWRPEEYAKYYFMFSDGYIDLVTNTSSTPDINRIEMGNCFRTENDAENAIEKLKALARLRDNGLKFIEWNTVDIENGTAYIQIEAKVDTPIPAEDLNLLFEEG